MRIGRYQEQTARQSYFQRQKNDATEGKRHQTADENRKQNEYKQKIEWIKTEN